MPKLKRESRLEKNLVLTKNFNRINKEVDDIIKELIPTDEDDN